ncbi:hypothetical protein [Paenibacillus abyssi]|uniref:Uncharacterized protein n=1 Tax=Paenibacillus abyssi TaxID=1340531 RepID=A0A917D387_9BACL|nr:hypothetical protein [Paenibacillus abyssi]GGG09190.1 hypothetical protein GCM10010916_27560 [Paenibacillus abyssi]
MRSILISVLMLTAAVILYVSIIEGEQGTEREIRRGGKAMSEMIRGIDP